MASFDSIPYVSFLGSFLVPAGAGLVTYLVYKKLEITPESPIPTALLLFVAPLASSVFLLRHYSQELAILSGVSTFYAALLSSIFIYRISPWHPLAKYPGPVLAKVSQFWLARETTKGKWHDVLTDLHAQYGPYVRIGPNQLSFVDASLVPRILGLDGMPKGPMFDGARIPGVPANVVATRSLSDHTRLRKPWAKGLSSASIKEYSPIIVRRALQLVERLDEFAVKKNEAKEEDGNDKESVDLVMWMSRFAFDFMGDMVFGGAFELMKDGDTTGIWGMINEQMKAQTLLQRLPWSVHIVHKLPFVVAAMAKFTSFVNNCVSQRFTRGPRDKDLFYHLSQEEKLSAAGLVHGHDLSLLRENCKVAVVAGSDTTATTLSNVFFYLLTNLDVLRRLRAELDEAFPPSEGDPFDFKKLGELPVLNAVVNETLRLQPPVPTDLQRAPAIGSGGKQIGDHFIPEGTSINVPPYVLHRQARYFSPAPDKFWVDRWLLPAIPTEPTDSSAPLSLSSTQSQSQPLSIPQTQTQTRPTTFVHDTSAYIPFSYGPANCAGKALALAEMRVVTALLLQRFDIQLHLQLTEGGGHVDEVKERWERERCSYFVMRLGELPVSLKRRRV